MARRPSGPWLRTGRGWYAKIRGKQVHLGPDEQAAWEIFRKLMASHQQADATPGRLVVAFLAWKAANVRPMTLRGYRSILERFLAFLGDTPAGSVEPRHVVEFCAARGFVPNTSKQVRRVIKTVWKWAKAEGLIAENKLATIKCGVIGRRHDVIETDLAAWLPHVEEPEVRAWVEVGRGTGMRPSELARLAWRDVDPARRRVLVREGKTGDRYVPISGPMLDRLRSLAKDRPDGPLLRNPSGRPWNLRHLQKYFEAASRRAGVKIVPMHLRHIFATRLCEAGTPSVVLARIMGHSSTRMVDQYYVTVSESMMLRALDRVG